LIKESNKIKEDTTFSKHIKDMLDFLSLDEKSLKMVNGNNNN